LKKFVKLPPAFTSPGLFVIDISLLISAMAENPVSHKYDTAKE